MAILQFWEQKGKWHRGIIIIPSVIIFNYSRGSPWDNNYIFVFLVYFFFFIILLRERKARRWLSMHCDLVTHMYTHTHTYIHSTSAYTRTAVTCCCDNNHVVDRLVKFSTSTSIFLFDTISSNGGRLNDTLVIQRLRSSVLLGLYIAGRRFIRVS